jgi:hypothetical protein
MRRTTRLLALAIALGCAGTATAGQQRQYQVSDRQLQNLAVRLDNHRDAFHVSFERAIDRSPIKATAAEDDIGRSVASFDQALDLFRGRLDDRRSNAADVEDVLLRASPIDFFMRRHPLDSTVQRDWQAVRQDMNDLAHAYDVSWDWNESRYPAQPGAVFHRITGTYQLDNAASDDPRRVAQAAARDVPSNQRQRTYQGLVARLEAPDLIAIERIGSTVTIGSSRAPRVTVEADGRDHAERWTADRTTTTRVTFEGERLVIATSGNRGIDFTVTFEPMRNDSGLQMTRTIDQDGLRQAVTVRSAYRRVSGEAQMDIPVPMSESVVPDGVRLVAVLDEPLSTTTAREGDLYTMTTRSPSEYEGAVIQGIVSSVNGSGRLTGRSSMSLGLSSIRLRDGTVHAFDGTIEDIRMPDGGSVRVNHEGTAASDESQTQKTVERGAIGAALGAIIGAIAGGGKGAAIGAVIGAGGGAGTVMVEGRDRLDLQRGTAVTITSGGVRGNPRTLPGGQR